MPLIRKEKISEFSSWALWHITEELDELIQLLEPADEDKAALDTLVHEKQKKEWLASRVLIKQLAAWYNISYTGIYKDQNGKPWLKDSSAEISISHSYPYATAIIHLYKPVGIDIEHFKPKLVNISERFLSPEELIYTEENINKLCIFWSAKEVLYKIYNRRKLIFKKDLQILPFKMQMDGFLIGLIHVRENSLKIKIRYIQSENFIIAFNV
jgi:4'-phosphopantetheinyl transferase